MITVVGGKVVVAGKAAQGKGKFFRPDLCGKNQAWFSRLGFVSPPGGGRGGGGETYICTIVMCSSLSSLIST